MIEFRCRCGHQDDLDAFDHPGLKPWQLRCPACGIVISRRIEVPEVLTDLERDLAVRYGVVPGRVVIDVLPQLELGI